MERVIPVVINGEPTLIGESDLRDFCALENIPYDSPPPSVSEPNTVDRSPTPPPAKEVRSESVQVSEPQPIIENPDPLTLIQRDNLIAVPLPAEGISSGAAGGTFFVTTNGGNFQVVSTSSDVIYAIESPPVDAENPDMLKINSHPSVTNELVVGEKGLITQNTDDINFHSEYDPRTGKFNELQDAEILINPEKSTEMTEVVLCINGVSKRICIALPDNQVNLAEITSAFIRDVTHNTNKNKNFVASVFTQRTVTAKEDAEELVMVGDVPQATEPTQESVQTTVPVVPQPMPQPVPPITPAQQAIVLGRSPIVSQRPLLAVRPTLATTGTLMVQNQPLVVATVGGQMVAQPIVSTSIGSLFQVTSSGDFVVQNIQPKILLKPEAPKPAEDKDLSNGVKDINGVGKPADQNQLIEVIYAHCAVCSSNSRDLKVCVRCRRPIPKDAKLIKMLQQPTPITPTKAPEEYKCYTTVRCEACGRSSLDLKTCVNCKARLPDEAPKIIVRVKVQPETKDLTSTKTETKKKKCQRKKRVEEPVTLSLISSDEEDGDSPQEKPPPPPPPHVTVLEKEPVITEDTLSPFHDERIEGGGLELNDIMKKPDIERAMVSCRSVRIGSYKVAPKERIALTEYGIYVDVPSLETKEYVTVSVMKNEIIKVLVNFGKNCPVLFFYVTARCADKIRKTLGMTVGGPYFDPTSTIEPLRRITLLPDKVSEETRLFIRGTYDKQCLLESLSEKEVDTILVKASPSTDNVNAPMMTPTRNTNNSQSFAVQTPAAPSLPGVSQTGTPSGVTVPVVKIMVYPPPPAKGGIPINTEDYGCLGEENFLNDIIIDFYLKYFVSTHLSPEDQKRTHVFSSFFYKRLTTKDLNPNPNDKRSPAERRHHRVRSWTKQVDLFSKDFIIIPINENSHWFLGVICFPGLTHAVRMADGKPAHNPSRRKGHVPHMIGGTTITRVNQEPMTITLEPDEEDRDEADAEDDDLEPNSSDEEPCEEPEGGGELLDDATHPLPKIKVKKEPLEPIKQPCILIFDSLVGASRSKVCATLREYIQVEYNVRHRDSRGKRDINKNTFRASVVKVPQQTNYTDCGLYVLQYVEAFFQNPITDYRMPIKQLVDWFDTTIVSKKRYQIQQLLHKLMEEQNVNPASLNLPVLNLHPEGTGKPYTEEEEDEEMGEEMDMEEYEDMAEDEDMLAEEEEEKYGNQPTSNLCRSDRERGLTENSHTSARNKKKNGDSMRNMEFQRPGPTSVAQNVARSAPSTPTASPMPTPQPDDIRSRLVRKDISITSSMASSIPSSISITTTPVTTSPAKSVAVPVVPQSISLTRKIVPVEAPAKVVPSSPAKLDPSAISITSSAAVKRKLPSPSAAGLKDIRNPRLSQPGTPSRSVEIKKVRPE